MANAVRCARSPKIILDISQTQSVYTKSLPQDQDIRSYNEENNNNSVKMEPCDYCGRMKGSCLCCRNFVKVMTDPYYDRSPSSDTLPPLNHHYSSPQPNVTAEGSNMISPGSNNSFISIEELNRKRRLSVSDYDYEEAPAMYVNSSDCVYEVNAKRGRFGDEVNMNSPGDGQMDSELYRKFYSTPYNGNYYQTDPPLMLKPFSGSTETVISIGGAAPPPHPMTITDCQVMHHQPSPIIEPHPLQEQPHQQQQQHHQQPPLVEAELPPIFTMYSNESAQTRTNPCKYTASPDEDTFEMEDDFDDTKSVDSRMASESETSSQAPKTRGRPRTGRVSKKKKVEKEVTSFEDMQQMRVMANVRERQRTQVN